MLWEAVGCLALVVLAIKVIYTLMSGTCRSSRILNGKTAIVTGASAGIGKETALDLARRGARVILACRNLEKAQKVADAIISTTGNNNVEVQYLDTSNLTTVRKFAQGILDTEKELHILVNNAGIRGEPERKLTDDGLELTMATNHYGHFLLTNLLLGLLKKSVPSRVVNVSSDGHLFCPSLDPNDFGYKKRPYPGSFATYAESKLANILFTLELSEKLRNTGVTTNCLHPGAVNTEILWKGDYSKLALFFACLFSLMAKDEKLGAQTIIYLAVSEEVENVTGKYFCDCKERKPSKQAQDHGLAKKFWDFSEQQVKLTPEERLY